MIEKKIEKKIALLIIIVFLSLKTNAQENDFTRSSIKTGIGVGVNEGIIESGAGIVYSVGYQKSFGKKEKFRINPNLLYGGFNSFGIDSTRDLFYRITSIGMNVNYDLVKYKVVSLFVTSGGFLNYSRGLFGTGGENENRDSMYFNQLYFGGTAGVGIRINSSKSRFAYEIKPLNAHFGNKFFSLGYLMLGLDIKIKK
jgi:hypothetical protein